MLSWSLKNGAHVNLAAIDGHTALWWACAFNQSSCAKTLLDNGGKFGPKGLREEEFLRWSDEVKGVIEAYLNNGPPQQRSRGVKKQDQKAQQQNTKQQKKETPSKLRTSQNVSRAAASGELRGRTLQAWEDKDAPSPQPGKFVRM